MSAGIINNTKHFAVTDTSNLIQDALNAGRLENPYVALVDGDLDYNSMEPIYPCYLGEWGDDGEGNYTFQILDSASTAWENNDEGQTIGQFEAYAGGTLRQYDVILVTSNHTTWTLVYYDAVHSQMASHNFSAGTADTWTETTITTDLNDSTSYIVAEWDGVDAFEIHSAVEEAPLTIDTIDPECPSDEL